MSKFLVKTTAAGFTFSLLAGNGEPVLTASESYSSKETCLGGVESVRTNAPVAALEDQTAAGAAEEKNPKFEVYTDKAGQFRFRLTARNGQNIGKSEGYTTKTACLNGVESVRKNAPGAGVVQED